MTPSLWDGAAGSTLVSLQLWWPDYSGKSKKPKTNKNKKQNMHQRTYSLEREWAMPSVTMATIDIYQTESMAAGAWGTSLWALGLPIKVDGNLYSPSTAKFPALRHILNNFDLNVLKCQPYLFNLHHERMLIGNISKIDQNEFHPVSIYHIAISAPEKY